MNELQGGAIQATIPKPTISDGMPIINVLTIQPSILKTNAMLQVFKGDRLILSLPIGVMKPIVPLPKHKLRVLRAIVRVLRCNVQV